MLRSLFSGGLTMQEAIAQILAVVIIVFLVLPFHEWAHGFVANKLGDKTALGYGRVKFNPLAHIDPMGALCLLLLGFGWAKPVPVNPNYFKNPKKGMAITAAAGPAANILAGTAGILLWHILNIFMPAAESIYAGNQVAVYVYSFLNYYVLINFFLAVFNLIPLPPLDGSKILGGFLPDHIMYNMYKYEHVFFIVLILLLATGVLSVPIQIVSNGLISGIDWLIGLPFRAFG